MATVNKLSELLERHPLHFEDDFALRGIVRVEGENAVFRLNTPVFRYTSLTSNDDVERGRVHARQRSQEIFTQAQTALAAHGIRMDAIDLGDGNDSYGHVRIDGVNDPDFVNRMVTAHEALGGFGRPLDQWRHDVEALNIPKSNEPLEEELADRAPRNVDGSVLPEAQRIMAEKLAAIASAAGIGPQQMVQAMLTSKKGHGAERS